MTPTKPASVSELRARVTQMQGRPAVQPVRTHPALSGLLQMPDDEIAELVAKGVLA